MNINKILIFSISILVNFQNSLYAMEEEDVYLWKERQRQEEIKDTKQQHETFLEMLKNNIRINTAKLEALLEEEKARKNILHQLSLEEQNRRLSLTKILEEIALQKEDLELTLQYQKKDLQRKEQKTQELEQQLTQMDLHQLKQTQSKWERKLEKLLLRDGVHQFQIDNKINEYKNQNRLPGDYILQEDFYIRAANLMASPILFLGKTLSEESKNSREEEYRRKQANTGNANFTINLSSVSAKSLVEKAANGLIHMIEFPADVEIKDGLTPCHKTDLLEHVVLQVGDVKYIITMNKTLNRDFPKSIDFRLSKIFSRINTGPWGGRRNEIRYRIACGAFGAAYFGFAAYNNNVSNLKIAACGTAGLALGLSCSDYSKFDENIHIKNAIFNTSDQLAKQDWGLKHVIKKQKFKTTHDETKTYIEHYFVNDEKKAREQEESFIKFMQEQSAQPLHAIPEDTVEVIQLQAPQANENYRTFLGYRISRNRAAQPLPNPAPNLLPEPGSPGWSNN